MSSSESISVVEMIPVAGANGDIDLPSVYVKQVEKGSRPALTQTTIPLEAFNDAAWISSTVARQIGVPLKVMQVPDPQGQASNTIHCRRINVLLANMDINGNDFAKYIQGPLSGKVFVARENGDAITPNEIELILKFLGRYVAKHLHGIESLMPKSDRQRLVYPIEPNSFRLFWSSYCNMGAAKVNDPMAKQGFLGLKCPITEDPSCMTCRKKGTVAKPLLKCGACKEVCYCDRTCQKADWKDRKTMCQLLKMNAAFGNLMRSKT